MLQLLKFLPRLPGISRLSLHTRAMASLTQTNPLVKFVESRVELLACFKAGIENDKYQDLLDTAEAAILYQASKVSVLTCSEAKAIIEILTRHDLFGEPRVNVLAAKILKHSQLMRGDCKPERKETHNRKPEYHCTHKQTNDYIETYFTKKDWDGIKAARGHCQTIAKIIAKRCCAI